MSESEKSPWSLLSHFRQLRFQLSLLLLETGNILLQNLHLARQLGELAGQAFLLLFNPIQFFRGFPELVKILAEFSTLALQQLQLLDLDGQLLLGVLTRKRNTFLSTCVAWNWGNPEMPRQLRESWYCLGSCGIAGISGNDLTITLAINLQIYPLLAGLVALH